MKLNWNVVVILSLFALIRPLMSILGVTETIGQPFTSLTVTLIISAVWIAAVVGKKVEAPIITLVMTGISYAFFTIILSAVLSPIMLGELMGPLTNPFAMASVFITNIVWGGITGVISWGILKVMK